MHAVGFNAGAGPHQPTSPLPVVSIHQEAHPGKGLPVLSPEEAALMRRCAAALSSELAILLRLQAGGMSPSLPMIDQAVPPKWEMKAGETPLPPPISCASQRHCGAVAAAPPGHQGHQASAAGEGGEPPLLLQSRAGVMLCSFTPQAILLGAVADCTPGAMC